MSKNKPVVTYDWINRQPCAVCGVLTVRSADGQPLHKACEPEEEEGT